MSLHPVIRGHLAEGLKNAKRDLAEQINELKVASSQVDQMLKESQSAPVAKSDDPSSGGEALAATG